MRLTTFLQKRKALVLMAVCVPALCLAVGENGAAYRSVLAQYSYTIDNSDNADSADEKHEKIVYLTIDDGPSPMTEKILQTLKQKGVPATFFVTAERPEFAYRLAEIVEQGHALGLHCYKHTPEKLYAYKEAYVTDFEKIRAYVLEHTGEDCKIYRFVCGSRNNVLPRYLEGELQSYIKQSGCVYFDWNAVAGDTTATVYPAQTLANNVIRDAGDSPVIIALFHDTPITTTTPDAIALVIDHYTRLGYRFAPLTKQTPPIQFDWKR